MFFSLVTSASDFQRLHNAISTNLNKISNNGKTVDQFIRHYSISLCLATDLETLVKKLGTPEDSEPLRER